MREREREPCYDIDPLCLCVLWPAGAFPIIYIIIMMIIMMRLFVLLLLLLLLLLLFCGFFIVVAVAVGFLGSFLLT